MTSLNQKEQCNLKQSKFEVLQKSKSYIPQLGEAASMRGPSGSGKKRTDKNKASIARAKTQRLRRWIRMGIVMNEPKGEGFLFPLSPRNKHKQGPVTSS